MRFYREGERSSAVCDVDKRKVVTVMRRRDYRPEGFAEPIPNLLVAVCELCGAILTVPAQSCARIHAMRRERKAATRPIDVKVSVELEDALSLVVSRVGGRVSVAQPALLRYYLGQVADSPGVASRVKERSVGFFAKTTGGHRISVRVTATQMRDAAKAAKAAGFRSRGELMRGVVGLALEDSGVSYLDSSGRLVTAKPDAAGRQRFARLKDMVGLIP